MKKKNMETEIDLKKIFKNIDLGLLFILLGFVVIAFAFGYIQGIQSESNCPDLQNITENFYLLPKTQENNAPFSLPQFGRINVYNQFSNDSNENN